MKRLYRSTIDKRFSGVCGGIATYFGIDATLVRAIWALVTFFTGIIAGLLAYIVMACIIPLDPEEPAHWNSQNFPNDKEN